MPLAEVKAEIPATEADAVEEILLDFGRDRWSVLENAVEGRAWIVGIFDDPETARSGWEELQAHLPADFGAGLQVRVLPDADWRDSYKAHFHAWQFGRLHWVPAWDRPAFRLPPGDAVLWLDPGMAFGTGNHETTRLCVERLVAFAAERVRGASVIDAGCGSGILALSAALLGLGPVEAFDNDPEAIRVSLDNAALNDLGGRVDFFVDDLEGGLRGAVADLVLANIQSDVLRANAGHLVGAVAAGGRLVLSGILAEEIGAVQAAFASAAPGWSQDSRNLGAWCDLALDRPPARP